MKTSELDKEDKTFLKIKYTLAGFLRKNGLKKWEDLTIQNAEKFSTKYIKTIYNQKIKTGKSLKGYVVQQFLYYLLRVIESETKNNVPKILSSRLKRTIHRVARPLLAQTLQKTNRAKSFKFKTIKNAIKILLSKNKHITDCTAVSLAISFCTAARLADVLNIVREDIKLVKNKSGTFVKILLRNSKNNQLGLRQEQLTYFQSQNSSNKINLQKLLKKFMKKHKNDSREKLINLGKLNRSQKLRKITYQYAKISKELNLKNKIGAHSGRNTLLYKICKNNIDDESKKIFMRWRPSSNMPTHYRGLMLECSDIGVAKRMEKLMS
jgi:hypothetical protein